jgi:hypothetical protein
MRTDRRTGFKTIILRFPETFMSILHIEARIIILFSLAVKLGPFKISEKHVRNCPKMALMGIIRSICVRTDDQS